MAAQHTISQKVLHCADRASFRATKRGLSAGRSDRREGAGEDDVCAAPVATDGSSRNIGGALAVVGDGAWRSEEHTSELQSLMRISYAVFCLQKKKKNYHVQSTKQ